MKILYVQDTDWIRRNPIQHTHLAERLVLRGHQIRAIDYEILWRDEGRKELFSKREEFSVSRIFDGANITVIRPRILKVPVLDYVSMVFSYRKEINYQIEEFKPDVIIGNDILTTYLAYRVASKKNIPTVFYAIDIEHKLVPYKFLQPMGKIIEKRNIRTADWTIAINEGLREYTILMGANPDKTLVIRAGISPEQFNPSIDGNEIREQYSIKKDDIVLLFMGWLYNFSGLKEVAMELSERNLENVKFLIVGDGDAFDDMQKIRDEYDMQSKIILTGRQPYKSMPKFIAASDICLLPAYNNKIMRDIVPIKMYEYMAMQKPVIATKLPGVMKEFGEDNGMVYIDNPKDAVAKALELVQGGRIEELGQKARKFVIRNSWDNITDEFESFLKEVIRQKHG